MRKTIGNISKKDYLENIKVFNDIEIPDRFSNYTISLDSIFKDVSFATFYKRLIRYQTLLNKSNVSSDKNLITKSSKLKKQQFDYQAIEESIKKMKLKDEKKENRIKYPYSDRHRHKTNLDLVKEKTRKKAKSINKTKNNVLLNADYNPSYDILTKHAYQVSFSKKNFYEFNENFNTIEACCPKKIKKRKFLKIFGNNTISNENDKIKIKDKFLFTSPPEKSKNNKIAANYKKMKNNNRIRDALFDICQKKFSKTQNNLIKTKNLKNNKRKSANYRNNNTYKFSNNQYFINFDKEPDKRNYLEDVIQQRNSNPPIGLYEPKYSFTFDRTVRNVYLNRKKLSDELIKRKILNKAIFSYSIDTDYKVFRELNTIKIDKKHK